jgi:putative colanic acid biosynthesis acetyltransferase WcaF
MSYFPQLISLILLRVFQIKQIPYFCKAMPNKVDLSKFDNTPFFTTGASFLKRACWHLCNGLFFKTAFHFYGFKVSLLRMFGATIGKNVVIKPHVNIKFPWRLEIGDNVWIGEQVWIDNLDIVTIGSNVCISQGAFLLCGNHDYKKTTFDLITKPITLEEGVWVGARSIVCGNVTCRSHSVLMVQSVAVKDLEAYGIYRGNPAEKIKERTIE